MKIIETNRLVLRTWKDEDAEAFFRINQDPKVIEYLMGSLTMEQVLEFMQKCNRGFEEKRFCLFAVELKSSHEMIGFIGLSEPSWESHFTPCVEIGWRLGSQYWGQGYATEGALAVLDYGFNVIGLNEIVSFCVSGNLRSISVMKKIGMKRDLADDFLHPKISANHPLSRHVLYRINRKLSGEGG